MAVSARRATCRPDANSSDRCRAYLACNTKFIRQKSRAVIAQDAKHQDGVCIEPMSLRPRSRRRCHSVGGRNVQWHPVSWTTVIRKSLLIGLSNFKAADFS